MKTILITGVNSYIGLSFKQWLENYQGQYIVESISLRNDAWKTKDFSKYDVVYHVAGIAHIKETRENANLYFKVNRDLTSELALKAKNEGVKQFIFVSSMSVYGIESGVIDEKSPLKPKSNYGMSKLQAEKKIKMLENDFFKVVILRPPMIYGKDCKGNYNKLAKIARKLPFFPNIENKRSMIYIDNLSELVRLLVENSNSGLFFPQNKEYVSTSKMVKLIADNHKNKIRFTRLFNPLLKHNRVSIINKVFGNLVYEKQMSEVNMKYQLYDLETSIPLTERGHLK
ncbi:NAD-dependent epimerase/dehydratase family protein [Alkalihalobacillus hwajinpoensis]|uniref:NAD-dependent epimerase/dehydratase family protein n=1 Tax=Guptibacillus hwajinpoensis TaxID=208199 RepID=UPI0018845A32|nr:NAD-dependent epimerase/dehydratase family protein [Pseudalkalibacillus hwajinpoensis]MBF0705382.1 NAD-dependent epimerase/dehydratase family protein [Pseudalkalibacillus hwajinpoensis]